MYQRPARSVSAGLMSATRRQLGNLRRATPTPVCLLRCRWCKIRSTHYVIRSYPNVLSLHGTHTAPCRLTGGWLASSYPTKIQAPRCSVMMCTLRLSIEKSRLKRDWQLCGAWKGYIDASIAVFLSSRSNFRSSSSSHYCGLKSRLEVVDKSCLVI
ncbi:hypothetical protein QC764_0031730 [Podospora pseudoanserina]|uniref:Uncharacterized protein n=1 Tax=Podospora pseudoanserina TaxID=2609844 RepID=A0ABR0IG47_9PEZI|nr:hypothetical protein QC764_0031730 [Podospora pseudoanserina]